jgi:pimeloyl-ACP methyl ester carboxylesterase
MLNESDAPCLRVAPRQSFARCLAAASASSVPSHHLFFAGGGRTGCEQCRAEGPLRPLARWDRHAFATTGTGPPLLRAGHWLTHLELDWLSPVWRPLLDALGTTFAVTRLDQRGTGLSERDVARFDLEAMTDDLEAVADAAGLNRFPILAASQGVPVAVSFAARRPERVTALLLYGGFAVGRLARGGAEAAEGDAFATLIESGWGRPGSAFVQAFATLFMPEASREQIDSFTTMQVASASPGTAVRLRRAIDSCDVRSLLPGMRAPMLVVHARSDAVQPLDQARLLTVGIAGAELLVLESRNHAPLPQDPAREPLLSAIRRNCGRPSAPLAEA